MPFLFREIVFCECGRPALPDTVECRTCYEDGLRRKWRDEFRFDEGHGAPAPVAPVAVKAVKARLRALYAPEVSCQQAVVSCGNHTGRLESESN